MPKIKICGITRPQEAECLNEAGVEYAGFVFYGKSRRNLSFPKARQIQEALSSRIQKVAVTVSPDICLYRQIAEAGLDILQVYGRLEPEVLEASEIPIWRACNIDSPERLEQLEGIGRHEKIAAYVMDAQMAGSGKTFNWKASPAILKKRELYFQGKSFVLAGGLHSRNVEEGIRRFRPDIVDVSTGVEADGGKDRQMILDFVRKVREHCGNMEQLQFLL